MSVVGNGFAPLSALATAPLLAHALGASGRGDVAAATAPLLLATSAATFGLPSAVTFVLARRPELRRRVTLRAASLLVVAGAVLSVLVWSASGWLGGGAVSLARVIALTGLAIVPGLLAALLQAVAAGAHRWGRIALERFVTSAARLVAVAVLAAAGELTVVRAVVVLALTPVLGALVYLPLLRRGGGASSEAVGGRAPEERRAEGGYRDLIGYGMRVWLGSVAGILLSRLDQAIMVPLAGPTALGVYVVAASIADLPLVVNSAVRDVFFSAQSAEAVAAGSTTVAAERTTDTAADRLEAAARLSTLVVTGVVVLVALPLPWLVPAVFGPGFGAAVPACWLLLAGVVLGNPGSVAGAGLSARGRPGLRSAALAVACLVNAALVVALVPTLGALGAALATAAGSLLAGWLNVIALSRLLRRRKRDFVAVRRSDLVLLGGVARRAVARRRV